MDFPHFVSTYLRSPMRLRLRLEKRSGIMRHIMGHTGYNTVYRWQFLILIAHYFPHNPPLCIKKELWLGASPKAKETSLHWEIPQGGLHIVAEQSNHLRAQITPRFIFSIFPLDVAASANSQQAPHPPAFAVLPFGSSRSPSFLEGKKYL